MNVELIFQDNRIHRFWNIEVKGHSYTVYYGNMGEEGNSFTKEFRSDDEALEEAIKLVNVKKQKQRYILATEANWEAFKFAGKMIKEFTGTFKNHNAVKISSQGFQADDPFVIDKLEKLANLPHITDLDTLIIGEWKNCYEKDCSEIVEKLIQLKDIFSGLKHLFIGDMNFESCEISWIQQVNYSGFFQHYPQLETFGVRGGQGLQLGILELPKLQHLIIRTGGLDKNVIHSIGQSSLPELTHLDVWLGTTEYGGNIEIQDLKPILAGIFPKLEYLGLKNYDHQDALAKALHDANVLNTIKTLDISMGTLTDTGAKALYKNERLLQLKHINCRHHYLSREWQQKLKEKFETQLINLKDAKHQKWCFVEVGE